MSDRRVVFASIEDAQIVRYEKAKKWYVVSNAGAHTQVPLAGAAATARMWAANHDGWVYPGLPGGRQFDRLVNG